MKTVLEKQITHDESVNRDTVLVRDVDGTVHELEVQEDDDH